MDNKTALQIIEHNREVYSQIAAGMNETRKAMHWPILTQFAQEVREGDKILDMGCGTGRLVRYFEKQEKKIEYTGIDFAGELLEVAKKVPHNNLDVQFKIGDMLNIPEKDSTFDLVFCIATLHHIPSTKLRMQAIGELSRVLKPGGNIFITGLNGWKNPGSRKNIKQIYLRKLFLKKRRISWERDLEWNDYLKPWKKRAKNNTLYRYYHAFTRRELNKLVERSGLSLEYLSLDGNDIVYGGKKWNWVVVAKKVE